MRSGPIALLLSSLALAGVASAEPDPAEQLFRDGLDAMDWKDFDVACAKFAESFRRSGQGGPRVNLAKCEEERGHLAEALRGYRDAVAALPPSGQRTAAEKGIERLARVPQLAVRVAPRAPPGTTFAIDGRAPTESPALVDVGPHTVTASAEGCETSSFQVTLRDGDVRSLEVAPRCASPATLPPPPPRTEVRSSSSQRTAGFIAGGVGVAGAVAFAITGALALSKQSEVNAHCPERVCDPTGDAARGSAKTIVGVNLVAFVVGALGLATGVVLIATSPRRDAAAALAARSRKASFVGISSAGALTW